MLSHFKVIPANTKQWKLHMNLKCVGYIDTGALGQGTKLRNIAGLTNSTILGIRELLWDRSNEANSRSY